MVTETVATAAQSRIGYALKVCVIVLITFERSVWTTSSCKHQTHAQVHNMYSCMSNLPIDDGRSEKKLGRSPSFSPLEVAFRKELY